MTLFALKEKMFSGAVIPVVGIKLISGRPFCNIHNQHQETNQ